MSEIQTYIAAHSLGKMIPVDDCGNWVLFADLAPYVKQKVQEAVEKVRREEVKPLSSLLDDVSRDIGVGLNFSDEKRILSEIATVKSAVRAAQEKKANGNCG